MTTYPILWYQSSTCKTKLYNVLVKDNVNHCNKMSLVVECVNMDQFLGTVAYTLRKQ